MRRIAFWLSLLMIFILPWEGSITIAAVGSIARLVGFAVAGFWLATILTEGRFQKPHLFHALVLLFVLWNVVSLYWTWDQARTILRIKTYIQLFLLVLILWELYKDAEDLQAGLQAYILGAFVAISGTIINYVNGRVISTYELRYSASAVNAVDLAVILILGLPIAWHLFILARNAKRKSILTLMNFAYMPLAVFSVILTGSRTSLFTAIPMIIYLMFSGRTKLTGKIVVFIILAISLLVMSFYIPQSIKDRLATVAVSVRTGDLGGRVNLWRQAIEVLIKQPLLGSGSGTLSTTIGSVAHNTLLSVLTETGIIGFTFFLFVLMVVFFQAITLPKGYSGLWLTVLMTWAIGTSVLTWEFTKPTWLFLSFVMIEARLAHERLNSHETGQEASAQLVKRSWNRHFHGANS